MRFLVRSSITLAAFAALALTFDSAAAAKKPAVWQPPSIASDASPSGPVAMANWTFVGCWSRSGTGCVDIYRDGNGDTWQCKACGTTKNAGPSKCTRISAAALADGRWCS